MSEKQIPIVKVSVLTLVKNRTAALTNLIKGLAQGTVYPDELVIVFMNEAIPALPEAPFSIRSVRLTTAGNIPLAKARNLAVQEAKGEGLIFLDVDCIPSKDLVANYSQAFKPNVILSGQVRYLYPDADLSRLDDRSLIDSSKPDPIRSGMNALPYELFWSLNFACERNTYLKIGGFDEAFEGYGAEDTDFSFRARQVGVSLQNVAVMAFHQHHAGYDPPLNHFADIVRNAGVFFQNWGKWPMEGWLTAFRRLGYIQWEERAIEVLSCPTEAEIESAKKS